MIELRAAYLSAADSAVGLLRDRAVAARWWAPSALPEFSVAGLAGHLAHQVFSVPAALANDVPDQPPIGLFDHYERSRWRGAGIDDEVNVGIRQHGAELAADGADALADRMATTIAELTQQLRDEPEGRAVFLPWGPWSLRLEDFLTTRLMEIAVHCDDLAVSVGIETPELPETALAPVLALLGGLAVRRHGQAAVLRALARAERAPATINAI
jgi:hypothetical protein